MKPTIIHRKKLFGGRETAADVHRKVAWAGGKCYRCGSAGVVVQLSYHQDPIELMTREPNITKTLVDNSDDGQLPVWKSKYGPLVLFWTEYACADHQLECEREAAKLPSRILVEIDRGPGADKVISQVPL